MIGRAKFDVRGGVAFCGPYAISSITGVSYSRVEQMVLALRRNPAFKYDPRVYVSQRYPIKGMRLFEVSEIMRLLGWDEVRYWDWQADQKKTLRLSDFHEQHKNDRGPYIVMASAHIMAYSRGLICDNTTKTPVPFEEFGHKRWEVSAFAKYMR